MILHAEIAELWESKKSGERFAFPIFLLLFELHYVSQ